MRSLLVIFLVLALAVASVAETKAEKDQRMEWWREARLGMFIHWGLYSIPAGKWGNNTNYAEWIRNEAHIPVGEYEKFKSEFNPVKFDADKWVKMAKDAGMKYIVITTKHHDGFDLFKTKYGTWNIGYTPFDRDIMKEMAAACKKEGLKMCWYHSIMDWHEPDYLPRRDWELKDRPVDGANFDRYVEYLRNQVTELLTNYGPIGVMWFDGEWESTWNAKYGKALYDLCRKLQPNVIVNNRVSVDRDASTEDASGKPEQVGDFTTPEQYIPPTGLPNTDWETCMTMNDHWGYNAYDKNWKSPETLIRNIIDIASKGGNYLLNIGPMSNGEFPPEAVERLKAIGKYMKVNGQAIYDTKASVFDNLAWGRSTTKREGDNTVLYLHVWDWPADGRLVVPSIGNTPEKATLLADGSQLSCARSGSDIVIQVPDAAPDPISSTVRLVVAGAPVIYRTPKIVTGADFLVNQATVKLEGGDQQDIRYTTDGPDPVADSTLYAGPFTITDTTTVKAASFKGADRVSSIAEKQIHKVEPLRGTADIPGLSAGFSCEEFHGHFQKMPDFAAVKADKEFTAAKLDIPMNGSVPEEYVGRYYTGYIDAPADEVYNFSLTSDDGSDLWVDGQLVIDNDGLHGPATKTGAIALGRGWHRIAIGWFNFTGGAQLEASWAQAGQTMQPLGAQVEHDRHMPKGAP